jgi:hypothetical protein
LALSREPFQRSPLEQGNVRPKDGHRVVEKLSRARGDAATHFGVTEQLCLNQRDVLSVSSGRCIMVHAARHTGMKRPRAAWTPRSVGLAQGFVQLIARICR